MVEDRTHQMFVVYAIELHHKVVGTRDVMTLDDLGNLAQLLDGILLALDIRYAYADEGTHVEAERLRGNNKAAAHNYAHILQLLDALVDGRTRDAALACDLEIGHTGILYQEPKYLSVGSIQCRLCHGLLL